MDKCTWLCLAIAITLVRTSGVQGQLRFYAQLKMDSKEMKLICRISCSKTDGRVAEDDGSEGIIVRFYFPNDDLDGPVFQENNTTIDCSKNFSDYPLELKSKLKQGNYYCEVTHEQLENPAESEILEIKTTIAVSTNVITTKILAEEGVNVTCKVEPELQSEPIIVIKYKRGKFLLAQDGPQKFSANASHPMSLRYVRRCERIIIGCSQESLIGEEIELPVYEELLPSSSGMAVLTSDQNVTVAFQKMDDESVEVVRFTARGKGPVFFAVVRLNCTFVKPTYLYRPIKPEDIYVDVLSSGGRKRGDSTIWSLNSSFHVSLDWFVSFAETSVQFECGVAPYAPKKFRVITRDSMILHDCNNLLPAHQSTCFVDCYSDEQEFRIAARPRLKGPTETKDLPLKNNPVTQSASTDAPCSTSRVNKELGELSILNGGLKILAFEVALDDQNNLLFDCVIFRGVPPLTGANVRKNDDCLKGDNCIDYNDASFDAFAGSQSGHLRALKISSAAQDKQLVEHIWGVHKLDNFLNVNFNISCVFHQEMSFILIKLNSTFISGLLSVWKLFASSILLLLLVVYTHVLPIWDYKKRLSTPGTVQCIVQDKREGRISKAAIQKIRKSEEKGKENATGSQRSKQEETKPNWQMRLEKFLDHVCPPLPHISLTILLLALCIAHIAFWCISHAGRKTDSVILSLLSIVTDLVMIVVLLRCSCMKYLAFKTRSIRLSNKEEF